MPTKVEVRRVSPAVLLVCTSALGVLTAFANSIIAFVAIEALGSRATLVGADNELGYPTSVLSLAVFAFALTIAVGVLGGARPGRGVWLALLALFGLCVAIQVWSMYLSFTIFAVALLVLASAAGSIIALRLVEPTSTLTAMPLFLTVAAVVGFFAAFRLVADKVTTFTHPSEQLSCNASVLVQCGANLKSWQGSLFGFPNPILGIGGWMAVLAMAIIMLAGVKISRWIWITFNIGLTGALAFVIWLIIQSMYVLRTLCPWCMVTWAVVIPVFWLVTLHNARSGQFGGSPRFQGAAAVIYRYVWAIIALCYIVVVFIAQARLDFIHHL